MRSYLTGDVPSVVLTARADCQSFLEHSPAGNPAGGPGPAGLVALGEFDPAPARDHSPGDQGRPKITMAISFAVSFPSGAAERLVAITRVASVVGSWPMNDW